MTRILFNKPPTTIPEQIERFKARGLIIESEQVAAHYLRFIGYYRFTGYCLIYQEKGSHQFKPNTSFSKILGAYDFDRKLRLVLMDGIERIEIAFRSILSDEMSLVTQNPFWFKNRSLFKSSEHWSHDKFLDQLNKELQKNKTHRHLNSYFKKYTNPYPPSWIAFETLSLGTISRLYSHLKPEYRKKIAKQFNCHEKMLTSWMHAITFLRNCCAHHSRIYDRKFTKSPCIPKAEQKYFKKIPNANQTLYAQVFILYKILEVVSPDSQWPHKFHQLILETQKNTTLNTGYLSTFLKQWETLPLYKFTEEAIANS